MYFIKKRFLLYGKIYRDDKNPTWVNSISVFPKLTFEGFFKSFPKIFIKSAVDNRIYSTVEISKVYSNIF